MTDKKNSRAALICAMVLIVLFFGSVEAIAQTRIMCLGDSITGSPGCWRALLWQRLTTNGYTNIDFVGTLPPQGCGFTYDGENEGHGGILATSMADGNQLPPWLSATNPNIVMMFLGTNDCWSSRATTTIITAFDKLVDQMRANNPNMKILVAQITPLNPSGCTACNPNVIALNAAIPGWASGKSTSASPIVVVDQYTGFDTTTDTGDGCHPNSAGDQKISDKWYAPLVSMLSGETPAPTAVTTPAPTATPYACLYARGDVNGNGTIDIVDALVLAQYYVGIYTGTMELCFGDANCNGTIDIVDALIIAQCYVGLQCNMCN